MPVLHYYPVIGGLETWTQNIAERLSKKAEIFVVTGKVKNQPPREIKNGVRIFRTSLFSLKNLSYSPPVYIFTALPFIFFKSSDPFSIFHYNIAKILRALALRGIAILLSTNFFFAFFI